MSYHIETLGFVKIITKLRKHPLKQKIIADITELSDNPYLGKYVPKHGKYELKYPNLRIYYIVKEGLIVICEEEYDGLILITEFGNKNHQKRYLHKK